jgi:hypothetical protein
MELFVPIESMVRRAGGLSVLGSLKATPFVRKVASEWTTYRKQLREAGRAESVGPIPQIALDGGNVTIEASIADEDTTRKMLAEVLRGFAVTVDETSGQATMITAVDNLDDRIRDEIKLYKRGGTTMSRGTVRPEISNYLESMGFDGQTGHMKKRANPATGTSTDSTGDGDDTPGYEDELDLLAAFQREFQIVITELGGQNEDSDLSPAEVLRQAMRIAMQRVLNVTDLSDGPASQAQVTEAQRQGQGNDFNNMFNPNGFELKKRMDARADDGGLLAKLSSPDRVSAGGLSASLLKRDAPDETMRKIDDGRGDLDISKVITEPDDLLKRLSARNAAGMRKNMSISVFDSAPRPEDFRGSYSPGVDGLPPDAKIVNDPMSLVAKLARRHARGGENHLHKLLH